MNLGKLRGFTAVRYQFDSKFEYKNSIGIIAEFFMSIFARIIKKFAQCHAQYYCESHKSDFS